MSILQTILVSLITALIGGGAVAALVSAIMQKKNERETRIFNAKLEAYREFIGHLKDFYARIEEKEEKLTISRLDELSSAVLLVGNKEINKKLKTFNQYIMEAYKKFESGEMKEKDDVLDNKIHPLGDEIEELMRKDLGVQK